MRRFLFVMVMSSLMLATAPAVAETAEPVVCDDPPQGTTVVGPNHSSTITVPSPARVPAQGSTDRKFQLDLSPAGAENTATVSSRLSWEITTNDWDLFLFNPSRKQLAASQGYQPIAEPGEALSATLQHCSLFILSVFNYNAVPADAVDPLRLTVTTGATS